MEWIKKLSTLNKNDVLIAGGKGASLGELINAKIPVPEGFVILSNTFERFMEDNNLTVLIDGILNSVDLNAIHTVEEASGKIQSIILNGEISEKISKEILESFDKLSTKFIAVRSSATSEDGVNSAWAGQLETFLNTTQNDLLINIKKCWASLFSPRAIHYRFTYEKQKTKISMGVVVQNMVESEKSGIAFSVHPVTEDQNQIIIEAGFGLGEAIVSGHIVPDSYVINKENLKIIDSKIYKQEKGLYKKNKGGSYYKKIEDIGGKSTLSTREIKRLTELIMKIENHYGFPVDIEWAKKGNTFFLLQARPITTLNKN